MRLRCISSTNQAISPRSTITRIISLGKFPCTRLRGASSYSNMSSASSASPNEGTPKFWSDDETSPSRIGPGGLQDRETEWAEDYGAGMLHPAHLGDLFCGSRYTILRKLGYGSYSTVWLARDQEKGQYVALKIMTADSSSAETESKMFQHLSRHGAKDAGKSRIMTLLNLFDHSGPNGVHRCLVFEVMGPSVSSMVKNLPPALNTAGKYHQMGPPRDYFPKYTISMAKRILRQTLSGIHFLHQNGVAHGDLQTSNILFSVKDLSSIGEKMISQTDSDGIHHVKVESAGGRFKYRPLHKESSVGEEYEGPAPRYLAVERPMTDFVDFEHVKVSDLGGAFFVASPPAEPITPTWMRSPEQILGQPIGREQDIWSFGCLIYEIVTNTMLFYVDTYPYPYSGETEEDVQYHANDSHFQLFTEVLGPLPAEIRSQWPRSYLYINEDGEFKDSLPATFDLEDETRGTADGDAISDSTTNLESRFDREKPSDLPVDEADTIKQLLRYILHYDIAKRPSTSDLLAHPWFASSSTNEI